MARPPRPTPVPPAVRFGKLPDYLGYQIRQAQSAIFRDFGRITAELGVTPGEFSLLTIVEANPGVNSVRLSKIYQLDKSTISLSVKRMLKRDLIRRAQDEEDRRFSGLWLTANGRSLLARVTQRVEEQEEIMNAALAPGERARLLDMLRRIAGAFA
jgi:DNA-binding MarR family transcriptional regulator